ncbi:MAG: BspA family leucine-rich repeat surface protein [Proteobacteria bacterium]|nr:BspA family leucine-rich repeat surface protein [Pseudomonadota bacterium]
MRTKVLVLAAVLTTMLGCSSRSAVFETVFETVWEVTEKDSELVLPFLEDSLRRRYEPPPLFKKKSCDFKILWGDEGHTDFSQAIRVTDCANVQNRSHRYADKGVYHVRIAGVYDGWGQFTMNVVNDANGIPFLYCKPIGSETVHLRGVTSFGSVVFTSEAFCGVGDIFLPPNDMPDTARWHDATHMFMNAREFNQNIGHWDTSNVRNMANMFKGATAFNQDIGHWDTSKVINMAGMFHGATAFNQDIARWDTSNVKAMGRMFKGAKTFNQDLSAWKLNPRADLLEDIFIESGMSQSNYCKLKKLPVWKDQNLGLYHTCPR